MAAFVLMLATVFNMHCSMPTEPQGTAIHVNANGNEVIATDQRPADYICSHGNWIWTGRSY